MRQVARFSGYDAINNNSYVEIINTSSTPGGAGIFVESGTSSGFLRYSFLNKQWQFYTEGGTADKIRMSISNSGSVGIGTTTPLEKLHIGGGGLARLDGFSSGYGTISTFSTGGLKLYGYSTVSTGMIDLDPFGASSAEGSLVRLFRAVNQTGAKALLLYKGDNSGTIHAQVGVDGAHSYFAVGGGNVGIGTTNITPSHGLYLIQFQSDRVFH